MDYNEKSIIDEFHRLYYDGPKGEEQIYLRTKWMNVPCQKCPLDLWSYQEIIVEVKPDLIVETGSYLGGSALFMAHILDILGHGEIVSIDILDQPRPLHPRITYIKGSSIDTGLVWPLLNDHPSDKRMVILDSDHSKTHVSKELDIYAEYVSLGSYLIVEDTNVNNHPVFPSHGDGPFEAVAQFLELNHHFIVDVTREKFLMTFNPNGYLKRIS